MTEYIYKVTGAVLTEREHVVPLDHARPDRPKITIFSRELAHRTLPPIAPCRPGCCDRVLVTRDR